MKNLYLLTVLCLSVTVSFSQTQLIGAATGNGDFENGPADWVFVNGKQANKWIVGPNATPGFSGNNAIYISTDGSSHGYSTTSRSYTYFYKDIPIPAGTKSIWMIFD